MSALKATPIITWASTALLGVGFVALMVIVGVTFSLAERAQIDLNSAIVARELSTAAVQLRYAIVSAESSERGYIASGNEIYLAPYGNAKAQSLQNLQTINAGFDPEHIVGAATQRLVLLVNQKFQEMDTIISLKRDGHDADALAMLKSNRGKALMDEANIFLLSTIRSAEGNVTEGVTRQKDGLLRLRLIIMAAAALILLVVAATVAMIVGFARYQSRGLAEVALLNTDLERRVRDRTAELSGARDRAELLLTEVNHRVANSLALVASMVGLQSRSAESPETKTALSETQSRIQAVALVHKRLYVSGNVHFVELGEFLSSLLEQLDLSMQDAGHMASLKPNLAPIKMPTDKSVSIGVIAAEWVTNAFKYAYPGRSGEIRVTLTSVENGPAELAVEDDGVGFRTDRPTSGTGLGTKLVNALAASLGASVEYVDRDPGTTARLIFPPAR